MIDLYDVIDSHIESFKSNLYTSIPCVITNVITEGEHIKWVNVKPCVDHLFESGEVIEAHTIAKVPLVFPSNNQGILSYPVSVGDSVLVLFAHNDFQKWLSSGQTGRPQTFRKFSLTDAIAIPCVQPVTSDIKAHKDNFQITFNDFTLSVTPSGETSLTTNGKVQVNTESSSEWNTESYTVRSNSVDIGNSSVNIVQYLSDLTDEISKITVGGAPIDNKAQFETLKSQIDQLL